MSQILGLVIGFALGIALFMVPFILIEEIVFRLRGWPIGIVPIRDTKPWWHRLRRPPPPDRSPA